MELLDHSGMVEMNKDVIGIGVLIEPANCHLFDTESVSKFC